MRKIEIYPAFVFIMTLLISVISLAGNAAESQNGQADSDSGAMISLGLILIGIVLLLAAWWIYRLKRKITLQASHLEQEIAEKQAVGEQLRIVERQNKDRLQSEKLYQMINDTLQEGLGIVDPDENFVFVNQTMAEIAGCSRDQLIGRSLKDLVTPDTFDKIKQETAKRITGEYSRYIVTIKNYRDEIRELEVSSTPWLDESGKYLGAIGLCLEVTHLKQISTALKDTEDRYQRMRDNIQDGFSIKENDEIIYTNDRFYEIIGCSKDDLKDLDLFALIIPEDKNRVRSELDKLKAGIPAKSEIEFGIIRYDGQRRFIRSRLSANENEAGIISIYSVLSDITEQRLAEIIRERADRILKTVNSYSEMFLKSGTDDSLVQQFIAELGKVAEVSRVYVFENHENEAGELICLHRLEWCAEGTITQLDKTGQYEQNYRSLGFERWVEAMEKGDSVFGNIEEFPEKEREFLLPQKIASLLAVPVFAGDRWWGFIGFDQCDEQREWAYMDIESLRTAAGILGAAMLRSMAEASIKASAEQFREMANLLPGIVFELNTRGFVTFVNRRSFEITGYQQSDYDRGFHAKEIFVHEHRRKIFKTVRKVIEDRANVNLEIRVRRKDDSTFPAIIQAAPIIEGGRIAGVRGIILDITDRINYENELKSNEARMEALYELAQLDTGSIYEMSSFVLERAKKLTGSEYGSIGILDQDQKWLEITSSSDFDKSPPSLNSEPRRISIESSGLFREAIISREQIINNDYSGEKVTVEFSAEGGIKLNRVLTVPVFDGSKIAAVIQVINKAADYDHADARQLSLLGTGVWKHFQKILADEALKRSESKFRSLFEGSLDVVYISTIDGRLVDINQAGERLFGCEYHELIGKNTLSLYADPHDRERFARKISEKGYLRNFEVRLKRKDGKVIDCLLSSSMRKLAGTEEVYYQGIIRELTEIKRLEGQLIQAQKMESVGRLAGGVAHDFNNLLTAIMGNTEMMLLSTPEQDPLHSGLKEIRSAADRAAILTRQLLAFSRKQTLQPKIISLNQIISNMDLMLRRIIGEDIVLSTIPFDGLWDVKVDPNQVEQVIVNLAVNARDAMPEGGELIVETSNIVQDESFIIEHPGVIPGKYARLVISDSGIGIPDKIQDQIFDPFFTTKETGKGTGLGLSTVYGIVKQSGGSIFVSSEPRIGTSFEIYFPAASAEDHEIPEIIIDDETLPHGDETILIVEDDENVRQMAAKVLKMQGYTVFETESGKEAFKITQQSEIKIDLLLTDIVMPNMSGPQLAGLIRKTDPYLKVLFMSGYTPNSSNQDADIDQDIPYLQKPFRPKSLIQKVREVLDNGGSI